MIIQHNMHALIGGRQLGITEKENASYSEKLLSGYRINRAADDAAGLMISEDMRSQIRGLNMASRNCEDGISLFQTTDGAMQEAENVVHRMRELCVQGANDTNVTADRDAIQTELNLLIDEIDRMHEATEFNTIKVFQQEQPTYHLQVGANGEQGVEYHLPLIDSKTLTVDQVDVHDYDKATKSIERCDYALVYINSERAVMGAMQNRIEHAQANDDNTSENLQQAESKLRDADMASSMVGYAKTNILLEAGQSMLTQSNKINDGILTLLR